MPRVWKYKYPVGCRVRVLRDVTLRSGDVLVAGTIARVEKRHGGYHVRAEVIPDTPSPHPKADFARKLPEYYLSEVIDAPAP